VTGIIRRKTS